jgi:hypothetical protein
MAMQAAGLFREENGTWNGFDAETAGALQDQLAWADPTPATDTGSPTVDYLTATISASSGRAVRIVTHSQSGDFFCIKRSLDAGVTWGSGKSLDEATAACGSKPWTARDIQPMPQVGCPPSADSGYLICRMVQALAINIMKTPEPL